MVEAIDREVLAALSRATGDDPEFLAELIDTYLDDAADLLTAMRTAPGAGDAEALRRAAHTLKSTSSTLGAGRLAEICGRLEHGDGSVDQLVGAAEEEFRRVAVGLRAARPEP